MNQEIEKYLKLMGKKISARSQRELVIEEIRSHLEEKIEELLKKGLSLNEATKQVLAEATPAKELGKKLNIAYRPIYLRYPFLIYSFSFSLLVIIAVISLAHFSVNEVNEYQKYIVESEKSYNYFFKDIKTLSEMGLIKNERNKNANELIYKNVNIYEQKDNVLFRKKTFCSQHKEIKNCFIGTDVKELGFQLVDFAKKDEIELSWVDLLLEYDHWNFFADDYIYNKIKTAENATLPSKIKTFASLPIPYYASLRYVVVLRVLEHIRNKNFILAQEIIDKLIQLEISTHTLVGQIYASNALKLKNYLIDKYKLKMWKRASKKEISLLKSIGYGWVGAISHLSFNEKHKVKLLENFSPQNGACVALFETITYASFNETFYNYDFPLEPKPHVSINNFSSIIREMIDRCDTPQLKAFISPTPSEQSIEAYISAFYIDEKDTLAKNIIKLVPVGFFRLPYIRGIVGSYLGGSAIPSYFDNYNRKRAIDKK
jgi:hypothetical protein